jgi:ankyrin repeat protein
LFDAGVIVAGAAAVFVVLAEGGAVSHACCCRYGGAPIHWAADGGHLSILEFLVSRGADVHAQSK